MLSKLRNVVFVGVILVVLNGFVFYFFDSYSYFVFSLISVVGYTVYVFDLVSKNYKIERGKLEFELIKQKTQMRLLKDSVGRQARLLRIYRERLDKLVQWLEKKPRGIIVEKPLKKKIKKKRKIKSEKRKIVGRKKKLKKKK